MCFVYFLAFPKDRGKEGGRQGKKEGRKETTKATDRVILSRFLVVLLLGGVLRSPPSLVQLPSAKCQQKPGASNPKAAKQATKEGCK